MQNKITINQLQKAQQKEQKLHWTDKKDLYFKKDYKDAWTEKSKITTEFSKAQNSFFEDLPDIYKITSNDRRILAQIGNNLSFKENVIRGFYKVLAKLKKKNPTLNAIQLADLYEARGFGRVFKNGKLKKPVEFEQKLENLKKSINLKKSKL